MTAPEFVLHTDRLAAKLREHSATTGWEGDENIIFGAEEAGEKVDWLAGVLMGGYNDPAPDDDAPFVDCPHGLEIVVYALEGDISSDVIVTIRPRDSWDRDSGMIQIATISHDTKGFGDLEDNLADIIEAAEAIVSFANGLMPSAVKLWGL